MASYHHVSEAQKTGYNYSGVNDGANEFGTMNDRPFDSLAIGLDGRELQAIFADMARMDAEEAELAYVATELKEELRAENEADQRGTDIQVKGLDKRTLLSRLLRAVSHLHEASHSPSSSLSNSPRIASTKPRTHKERLEEDEALHSILKAVQQLRVYGKALGEMGWRQIFQGRTHICLLKLMHNTRYTADWVRVRELFKLWGRLLAYTLTLHIREKERKKEKVRDRQDKDTEEVEKEDAKTRESAVEFDELVQRGLAESIVQLMTLHAGKSYEVQKAGVVLLFRMLWFPEEGKKEATATQKEKGGKTASSKSFERTMRPTKGGLSRTRSGTWIRSRVVYDEYSEQDIEERDAIKKRKINKQVYTRIKSEGGIFNLLKQIEDFPEYFNKPIRIRAEVMRAWFACRGESRRPRAHSTTGAYGRERESSPSDLSDFDMRDSFPAAERERSDNYPLRGVYVSRSPALSSPTKRNKRTSSPRTPQRKNMHTQHRLDNNSNSDEDYDDDTSWHSTTIGQYHIKGNGKVQRLPGSSSPAVPKRPIGAPDPCTNWCIVA